MLLSLNTFAFLALLALFVPLPVGTDRRVKTVPWITYGLIGLNVFCFLLTVVYYLINKDDSNLFAWFGLIPVQPSFLQLFSSLFLHVSFAHLLWNMLFLWLFGPNGEDALGHIPFLIFYIAGGVAAGLLHMAIVLLFAFNTPAAFDPLVGASGAVSAVVGLYAVRFYRSRIRLLWVAAGYLDNRWGQFTVPALVGIGLWLVQNVTGAVESLFQPQRIGIAYWAHIGGFVFGMVAAELTDMIGDEMHEYLFAGAGPELRGPRDAARRYRMLLQRRPDDTAARGALAHLSAATSASPKSKPGSGDLFDRRAIAEAYAALMETALVGGNKRQAEEWREQMRSFFNEHELPPSVLSRLAARYVQNKEYATAASLYSHVARRYPKSDEAEKARLDAAMIYMTQLQAAEAATQILTERPPATLHTKPSRTVRMLSVAIRRAKSGMHKKLSELGLISRRTRGRVH